MTTKKTLTDEVKQILASLWEFEETTVVPSPENIRLNNNHAKLLKDAVVLYADLKGSTNMVDTFGWQFSAEIYKVYLRVASQLINYEGGVITSYDGDRVMAVFTGKSKNTSAARAALRVNWAVDQILRPAITNQYPKVNFYLSHSIGVASSDLHAVRIGIRGENDITWVGKAANHAAKLTNLKEKPLWVTKDVYDSLADEAKFASGKNMWNLYYWADMKNIPIYYSTYYWGIS